VDRCAIGADDCDPPLGDRRGLHEHPRVGSMRATACYTSPKTSIFGPRTTRRGWSGHFCAGGETAALSASSFFCHPAAFAGWPQSG
jgi:hypothetical protein